MSLYNDASLVMIPSAYKDGKLYSIKPSDGSGDFTFSRGSNLAATRVDVNGLIEKGRENLLLQSNQFDTTWATSNASVTSGQSGYDGTNDAWLISKSAAGGRVQQNIVQSGVQTFSVYAKAGSLNWIYIRIDGSAGNHEAYFDLQNGVIGINNLLIDSDIQSEGNGYYRCSISFNDTISITRLYVADGDGSYSAAAGSIYIQDAQLEVGLVATDYIETTTTTAQAGILEDMPRLDYSGGASCPSLLLEPTRTNLIQYSEDFTTRGGYWQTFGNATKTLFAAISPDGYNTAAHITGLNGDGTNDLRYAFSYNTANKSVVYSVYLKGSGTLRLQISNGVDQAHSEDITLTSDWQRHSVSGTFNSTSGATTYLVIDDFNGKTATEYYVWGAQFEEGSYATSYIPCYGAATTRTYDVCKITGANAIIDNPSMTLFAEMNHDTANTNITILSIIRKLSGGFYGDFISFIMRDNSKFQIEVRSNNTAQAAVISSSISSGNHKIAAVLENNNVKLFVDGVLVGSDTSVTLPTGLDEIYLAGYPDASTRYGTKKQYSFFPTALTDSEAIALTTL